MMRTLLAGLSNVDNYIDDVLVYTETWVDHLGTLRSVFQRIREANLTIKPSKSMIGYENIEFVGHQVTAGEIRPQESIVNKFLSCERPTTKKQIRSFIGLANYYRAYVPNFAAIAAPLTDLSRKGCPNKVNWDANQEHAYQTLRKYLSSDPILKTPNFNHSFILQTDASDTGIGGVLLQEYDDKFFPVAFASKKLNRAELSYSTIEKECLALVWSVS